MKAFRLSVKTTLTFFYRKPISSKIFVTYFAERATGVRFVNSASVVLRAIKVCFFDFYRTRPLATKTR